MIPEFYIVDVFAESKFAGNQLAVFRNTSGLSDGDMQKIASEMHYSETTFITSEKENNGGYNVRIFTPKHELPFAGHPTLGTAYIICKEIIKKPIRSINLNLKVGVIPVSIEYTDNEIIKLWMKQKKPEFGRRIELNLLADALNIKENDFDHRYPVEEVSTGVPFIIAPLKNMRSVKKARVNLERFEKLTENLDAKAILIFCDQTEKPDNQLHARVFTDLHGIPEDPATGSANGCLAGYLIKNSCFGKNAIDIRVEQGYEIGRPSILCLRANRDNDNIEINVGGKAFLTARGKLV